MDQRPKIRAHHRERLALAYARQSTPEQVRDNTGSTQAQLALAERAVQYGWPPARVRTMEELGWSGSVPDGRPVFREVLELVESDQVGLVLAMDVSRLGRNGPDVERFLHAV